MATQPRALVKTTTPKTVAAIGNPLIEASFKLDRMEFRMVMFVASLIHDEHEFYTYSFSVEDFAKAFGRKKDEHFYGVIRELCQKILKRTLELKAFVPEEGAKPRDRDTVWFRYFDYFEGEGRVEVCLQDFLKPYLLDLKREFTRIAVRDFGLLQSFYGQKLYLLLSQYRKFGARTFTLPELRLAMGVEPHEYPVWYDFRKWVIEAAVNDLRQGDILEVIYEPRRRGRKIHEVTFRFYTPGTETKDVTPTPEESADEALKAANRDLYDRIRAAEPPDMFDTELASDANALAKLKVHPECMHPKKARKPRKEKP